MKTVYFGTSAFAAAVLERLAGSPHRPALVVTRPDRPRGRGRALASPPVAEFARRLDLPLDQPEDVNGEAARARIAAAGADIGCVCAFGALIREPLLSEIELLNVHPSLLPRWRGAAPIERAIMAGDAQTGVSIMRVTAGLDSGPVCLVEAEAIQPDDDYGLLASRLQALGGELLLRALDERPPFIEQDDAAATYAERVVASDRVLDPARPAVELDRVVRALHPHIGARLVLVDGLGDGGGDATGDGGGDAAESAVEARSELGVLVAHPLAGADGGDPAPPAGRLVATDGRLLLGCGEGVLDLEVVQPPGGRPMDAAAYIRGHRVDVA